MKIMASGSITSWEIDGETVETVSDFIFGGSKMGKTESPKGERAGKLVISLPSEKWVLKIGFLKVQNW